MIGHIQHYTLKVLPLALVTLLECTESGLWRGSGNGGKAGDSSGPLADFLSDVGQLVSRCPEKTAQISGASGNLKPEVVETCLGSINHCGFHNEDQLGWLRELPPCWPLS